jgi:transmembrane sensor
VATGSLAYGVSGSYLWQRNIADYATRVGETRNFTLADGTHIWLNTETAVDIEFSENERRIILKAGEVLIVTAQDTAQRPFIVQTQEGTARPIGTRFSVRQGAGQSQLAVYEGAVELSTREQSQSEFQRVNAGQGTRFTREHIFNSGGCKTFRLDARLSGGGTHAPKRFCD